MLIVLTASILIALATSAVAEQEPMRPMDSDANKTAPLSPIIWADVPDMSIIRVGRDYYMSSTTMHMNPGLPIMRSRDLVHWKLVSYAYKILGSNESTDLANGKNEYGKGSWASSLRYRGGRFYASTFSQTTGRTHIFSTTDPSKTPWNEVSFAPAYHDHSLFFDDDGRVYLLYGTGDIRLVELKSDLSGPKESGPGKVIISNASGVAGGQVGLPAEGSQLFKVDGKYYLCNITWPRGGMRTQIVHRASRIEGPYEGRIMFQHEGIAQGGLIDTPDGRWMAYLFQDSGAVGRIPFILPVEWVDGWPVVKPQSLNADTPAPAIVADDSFDGPNPNLAWQWNHNPDNANYSLAKRPGYLRLSTSRVDHDILQARNTLTQRTFGPACSGTICLETQNLKDGGCAGLMALQGKYGYVGVRQTGESQELVMASAESGEPVVIERVPLSARRVYLRLDCNFKNREDTASFYFSLDGKKWQPIGKTVHLRYELTHFMGCRFGLFAYSTKETGGFADFDWFKIGTKLVRQNP